MVGFQVCLEPVGGTAAKLAGMSISKWSRNARAGYIINYTEELSRNSRTSRKKKNSSSLRSAVSKHTQCGSSCCCKPSSSPRSPPALGIFLLPALGWRWAAHVMSDRASDSSSSTRRFRARQQNSLRGPSEPERRRCLVGKKNTQSWGGYGKIR